MSTTQLDAALAQLLRAVVNAADGNSAPASADVPSGSVAREHSSEMQHAAHALYAAAADVRSRLHALKARGSAAAAVERRNAESRQLLDDAASFARSQADALNALAERDE